MFIAKKSDSMLRPWTRKYKTSFQKISVALGAEQNTWNMDTCSKSFFYAALSKYDILLLHDQL